MKNCILVLFVLLTAAACAGPPRTVRTTLPTRAVADKLVALLADATTVGAPYLALSASGYSIDVPYHVVYSGVKELILRNISLRIDGSEITIRVGERRCETEKERQCFADLPVARHGVQLDPVRRIARAHKPEVFNEETLAQLISKL